jgi:DHA1 family bicyclomycin/chloramphenicol resistance-like MFS transporter
VTVASPGELLPTGRRLQLVLVLGLLTALGPLTIDMYLPALPTITNELHASAAAVQLTLTGTLVGLAVGQLVVGPLADTYGRRRPLLMGVGVHVLASALCVFAPGLAALGTLRVLQGLGAAAASVVAMAVVRDLFSGVKAAVLLSRLILVLGVAPLIAPSLGSALLAVAHWQGIFVVLAIGAWALFAVARAALPETLPPSDRHPVSARRSLRSYAVLFADKPFVTMVLVSGLVFAALFAYVAGVAFILQGPFGLSPQEFGLIFSANAAGLILISQLNPRLVRRHGPVAVLTAAVASALLSTLVLLITTSTGFGGLAGFEIPMWFVLTSIGLCLPNAPAIALNAHGDVAGTASAMLGAAQFVIAGLVAPLVGGLGNGTPVPLAAILVITMVLATLLFLSVRPRLGAVSYG